MNVFPLPAKHDLLKTVIKCNKMMLYQDRFYVYMFTKCFEYQTSANESKNNDFAFGVVRTLTLCKMCRKNGKKPRTSI